MWWVYIIECDDSTLYTGITTDPERRFAEHSGKKGAKYFRGRIPLKMVFTYSVADRSVASRLEYRIKRLSKIEKKLLIASRDAKTIAQMLSGSK